jgi:threonine/homoserine/homoserine lactone efflux protein
VPRRIGFGISGFTYSQKWIGAAYLIYLGVKLFKSAEKASLV